MVGWIDRQTDRRVLYIDAQCDIGMNRSNTEDLYCISRIYICIHMQMCTAVLLVIVGILLGDSILIVSAWPSSAMIPLRYCTVHPSCTTSPVIQCLEHGVNIWYQRLQSFTQLWKIHYRWPCSIAMLNCHRVYRLIVYSLTHL